MQICPKCGHPGVGQPPCVMCGWLPAPPPAQTLLLVNDQVVTMRWRVVAGVPVGEPVDTRSFWDWLQRREQ